MLVVTDGKNAVGIRGVWADDDCDDSMQLLGTARIYALDSGMWMRRVQNLADQHARESQVVGVFASAGSLAGGVNHGDGLTDYGEVSHIWPCGDGRLARRVERSSTKLLCRPYRTRSLSRLPRAYALG